MSRSTKIGCDNVREIGSRSMPPPLIPAIFLPWFRKTGRLAFFSMPGFLLLGLNVPALPQFSKRSPSLLQSDISFLRGSTLLSGSLQPPETIYMDLVITPGVPRDV